MKLWKWWIVLVAVVSGPWFGLVRAPQWDRVTWIPFHGVEDKPRDIAANFLLFVPFGLSFAHGRRGARGVAAAVLASLVVSLCVETSQLFYRLRDPSATDVAMAMMGTAGGALAAQPFNRAGARGWRRIAPWPRRATPTRSSS